MCEDLRKALVAERIMNGQLEKRIVLMESMYKQSLDHERAMADAYSEKAVSYWKVCLKLRAQLMKLTGTIEEDVL